MKLKLSDVAEIRSGYQFRERVEHDPSGQVPVIQIKDLTADFRLRTNDLIRVHMEKAERHLVRQDDVLFLARGHRLGAAAITESIPSAIATGYFLVLRPTARVRARYLAWAINQPDFQERMRPLIRGSHIPLITKSEFAELQIAVPPIATQDTIVAVDELQYREQQLDTELQAKRAELIHTVCRRAAQGQFGRIKE